MQAFFHPEQLLHLPRTYLSRGAMRQPQEVPERASRLLQAITDLGFEVNTPPDAGMEPLRAVHADAYLEFLRTAHGRWLETSCVAPGASNRASSRGRRPCAVGSRSREPGQMIEVVSLPDSLTASRAYRSRSSVRVCASPAHERK